ncbi:MAG: hypothetical protein VCD33_04280 [Alphaproteobacteria bacterium]
MAALALGLGYKSSPTRGLTGAFPMKKLSILFAALFVVLSGEAFGFDRSTETSAQIYFSIPFGGQTVADATPRLGLSAGTGRDFVGYTGHNDNFGTYSSTSALSGDPFTVARESLDFRLGIDGTTSLYLNGSNVDEQIKGLRLTQDELEEGWLIPLGVVAVTIMIFAVAKSVK